VAASIADKGHLAPISRVMDYNTFCARNRQRWVMTVSTFYGYSHDQSGHAPLMSLLSLTVGLMTSINMLVVFSTIKCISSDIL
jgi:hypothetical protein